MAIQGSLYPKTAWAFQERPVASSKLNTWDDRIEAALELLCFLLNHAWGGGEGVIRGATSDDLRVAALATPGLSVEVRPGYAFISKFPYKLAATTVTPAITPPPVYPRIDLVQAVLATWTVSVKGGVEAGSPIPPPTDAGCIALAQLHLRPGMTSIKDTDDAVNGYITDDRQFL